MKKALGLLLLALLALLLFSGTSAPARFAGKNPYLEPSHANAWTFWRMRLFGDDPWADQMSELAAHPERVPTVPIDIDALHAPVSGQAQLTWLGHATFLLQYRGFNILTDPLLSLRASPVTFAGPQRMQAAPLTVAELPVIDWVVISHNHYDHLDVATLQALPDNVRYAVPLGLRSWFAEIGIASERVYEFDWWDSIQLDALRITATPSQHWSARSLWDRNETLWASWLIEVADFTTWFAGDTGYNPYQFKEIGEYSNGVDVALIPIGAYQPRWFMKPQHVDPAEAILLHQDVGATRSYAMHWGTYQLAAESLEQTQADLLRARQAAGLTDTAVAILPIGATEILRP